MGRVSEGGKNGVNRTSTKNIDRQRIIIDWKEKCEVPR